MQFCCICKCLIKTEIDIFKEQIGDPPVPIIYLIHECIPGLIYDDDEKENICVKCTGKLLLYYKASLIVKKIKNDFQDIIRTPTDARDTRQKTRQSDESTDHETETFIEEEHNIVEEEFIKIEYVDNTDGIFDEIEEEIEFEEVPELLKTEFLEDESELLKTEIFDHDTLEPCDTAIYDVLLEIEKGDDYNTEQLEQSPKNLKQQNDRSPISCAECNIEFKTERKYNAHRRKEHFAGYVCDQCGKTFYSHSGFVTHHQTHKAVKEFVCNVCGREFHHKVYLQKHMAWHSGEMPYQCDICSKRFVHTIGLQKHKKLHVDIRPIECETCGFKFRTNAHLKRHMLTHTGAKPHSCPICGKCFSQVYNMRVHIKEHEKPGSTRRVRVKCSKCLKTFSSKANYEDHILKNNCQYLSKAI